MLGSVSRRAAALLSRRTAHEAAPPPSRVAALTAFASRIGLPKLVATPDALSALDAALTHVSVAILSRGRHRLAAAPD